MRSALNIFNRSKILMFAVLGLSLIAVGGLPVNAWAAFEEPLTNSCITCHKDLPDQRLSGPVGLWASSVHAEVGNTCDGCHGGDPNDATVQAMADGKQFYLGPKENEVTGFCGKCHQELSEYFKESAHWATGTQNCIQCHGTHTVQRISIEIIDEDKCGSCHDTQSADKLKAVLLGLHDRFGASKEKIKTIRGLPTEPLEKNLDQVWRQLREVRMVSHTFDMTRIAKKAEAVQTHMETLEAEIARLEDMERERRWLGFGLIALFAALSLATYLYNRTIKE